MLKFRKGVGAPKKSHTFEKTFGMAQKNVFVTGGTGLVGAHLLVELAKAHHHVTALKRTTASLATVRSIFSYYDCEHLFETINWVTGDITDITVLEDCIEKQDVVYHTAAMVSFDPRDRDDLFHINVEGTANVVNACLLHDVSTLVYVSSTAAVGKGDGKSAVVESNDWSEDTHVSNYALSKHYAENEVWRGNAEGLRVIVVNPCVIIGPGDWNKSSATIFKTIYQGLRFYTAGANAFVDVRDVVKAMLLLEANEVFNERFLLIGENLTYQALFNKVAKSLGVQPPNMLVKGIWVNIFWRLEWVRAMLFNVPPKVTKESAHSASNTVEFSAQKIQEATHFRFRTINEAADNAARYFLAGK